MSKGRELFQIPQRYRFSSKSQLKISLIAGQTSCFRYHKGTDFQANHNSKLSKVHRLFVVLDTTKVQIFKQITTCWQYQNYDMQLFQIPQRYRFSSKSQLRACNFALNLCCFRYHKGTDFQANHNDNEILTSQIVVVLDTTKVQIFKQITTRDKLGIQLVELFQIPQRYRFSSKSQRVPKSSFRSRVVLDTTKVQIFKQITTKCN